MSQPPSLEYLLNARKVLLEDHPPAGSLEFYRMLNRKELEKARRSFDRRMAKVLYDSLQQRRGKS